MSSGKRELSDSDEDDVREIPVSNETDFVTDLFGGLVVSGELNFAGTAYRRSAVRGDRTEAPTNTEYFDMLFDSFPDCLRASILGTMVSRSQRLGELSNNALSTSTFVDMTETVTTWYWIFKNLKPNDPLTQSVEDFSKYVGDIFISRQGKWVFTEAEKDAVFDMMKKKIVGEEETDMQIESQLLQTTNNIRTMLQLGGTEILSVPQINVEFQFYKRFRCLTLNKRRDNPGVMFFDDEKSLELVITAARVIPKAFAVAAWATRIWKRDFLDVVGDVFDAPGFLSIAEEYERIERAEFKRKFVRETKVEFGRKDVDFLFENEQSVAQASIVFTNDLKPNRDTPLSNQEFKTEFQKLKRKDDLYGRILLFLDTKNTGIYPSVRKEYQSALKQNQKFNLNNYLTANEQRGRPNNILSFPREERDEEIRAFQAELYNKFLRGSENDLPDNEKLELALLRLMYQKKYTQTYHTLLTNVSFLPIATDEFFDILSYLYWKEEVKNNLTWNAQFTEEVLARVIILDRTWFGSGFHQFTYGLDGFPKQLEDFKARNNANVILQCYVSIFNGDQDPVAWRFSWLNQRVLLSNLGDIRIPGEGEPDEDLDFDDDADEDFDPNEFSDDSDFEE